MALAGIPPRIHSFFATSRAEPGGGKITRDCETSPAVCVNLAQFSAGNTREYQV